MRKPPAKHRVKPKDKRYRPETRREGYIRGQGRPVSSQRGGGKSRNVRPRLASHEKRIEAQRKAALSKERITRKDLRKIHRARSQHAQRVDEALVANQTEDLEKWAKAPNRSDVLGVDYFPVPFTNNFRFNTQAIGYAMEQYYGVSTENVPVKQYYTLEDYAKAYGGSGWRSAYAFHDPKDDSIHFSPQASKILTKGELENVDDFNAYSSIVHEYGHAIGDVKDVATRSFDEGSNELMAHRFSLLSLQLEPSDRKYFYDKSFHSYPDETRIAGAVALIANDYDEGEAIEWLKKLRSNNTSETEKEKMIYDAEMKLIDEGVISESLRSKPHGYNYFEAEKELRHKKADIFHENAEISHDAQANDGVPFESIMVTEGEHLRTFKGWNYKKLENIVPEKTKRDMLRRKLDRYSANYKKMEKIDDQLVDLIQDREKHEKRRRASPIRGSMTQVKKEKLNDALRKHDRDIYDRWWLDV